ncbi:MAG: class II aldolase/adducin family protein [Firmicutes bacterium]|nr:class II aldolase/adducin family protein [Bacillota bacterium]
MNLRKAREIVVLAGKQLLESGLIARTWGNVSCRTSETQFVITPSGRSYETLTPDEIVLVNIGDCSYVGDLKPSSEKGIHAEVYKQRRDVNFIIHTHQANASMVSPLQMDIDVTDPEMASIIGPRVPTAAYGLPGTKKLVRAVAEALMPNVQAVIMAYHGALCMGQDYEEAFQVASTLEKACADFVKNVT